MGIENEDEYKNNMPGDQKAQLESGRSNVDAVNSNAQKRIDNVFKASDAASDFAKLNILTGGAVAAIDKGGYNSPERDTYDVNVAYNDWQSAKKRLMTCPLSVRSSAKNVVEASDSNIQDSYSDYTVVKSNCNGYPLLLRKKANQYIETIKRVENNNRIRENTFIPPAQQTQQSTTDNTMVERFTISSYNEVEGFELRSIIGGNRVMEGLDAGAAATDECSTTLTGIAKTNYETACSAAKNDKTELRKKIDAAYTDANDAIEILNTLAPLGDVGEVYTKELDSRAKTLQTVLEQQKKDVNTSHRKAFYENQQFTLLLGFEGVGNFLYQLLLWVYIAYFIWDIVKTRFVKPRLMIYLVFFIALPNLTVPIYKELLKMGEQIRALLPTLAFTQL